jgi:hypothetical protein
VADRFPGFPKDIAVGKLDGIAPRDDLRTILRRKTIQQPIRDGRR